MPNRLVVSMFQFYGYFYSLTIMALKKLHTIRTAIDASTLTGCYPGTLQYLNYDNTRSKTVSQML